MSDSNRKAVRDSDRCSCGSDRRYKPGDRISFFDFCLLCWGTGKRHKLRGRP